MVPTSCSGPNLSCLISCSPGFGLLATLAIDATERDVNGCAFNLNTCAGTVGGATRSAAVRSCCRTVAAEPRTGLGNGVSFRGGTPASGRLMRVKRGFGIGILQVCGSSRWCLLMMLGFDHVTVTRTRDEVTCGGPWPKARHLSPF